MNPFEFQVADPAQTSQDWRQTIAKTASMEMKVQADRDSLASDKEFQNTLKAIAPNLPVMQKLGAIASASIASGRFSEAEKAITVMSTLENRDSLAEQRTARIAQANATAAEKRITRQMELYSGVSDAETKAVADQLYEREFGQPSPLSKYPYSPKLVEMAKASQVKQLDGLTAALRQAQAATIYADDQRADALAKTQQRYYEARIAAVKAKTANNVKTGGKLAEPKANEIRAVEAKILVDHPDLEPAEFDLAVREVAADAKEIQLREHGSFTDAMEKALQAREGQFTRMPGMKIGPIPIPGTGGKSKYTALPQGIPARTKIVGRTPDGRNVWKAPNGKQYAEPAPADDAKGGLE